MGGSNLFMCQYLILGNQVNWKPCHCPFCNGKLRDKRTIRKHFSIPSRSVQNSSNPANAVKHIARDNCSSECSISESDFETVHASGYYEQIGSSLPPVVFAGNPGSPGTNSGDSIEANDHDNDDDMCSESQNSFSDEEIEKMILRLLESKVMHGWSQNETLCQVRNFYELVHDDRIPHKSWNSVLNFLRKLGYEEPCHYKVCCSSDHVTLLEDQEQCTNCGEEWHKGVDYFVLGLNLRNYFLNPNTVKDHLAHWEHKGEWLNKENLDTNYKELWHGARFRELSYFWDDAVETFLPTSCPNCNNIVSVDEMIHCVLPGYSLHDPLNLSCTECLFDFVHQAEKMTGCALNQAFLFHEDGFNAFMKKSRGIAAIHIGSGCITKEQRSCGKYMRVYSFIPSFSIGQGITHKIDAFFKPLINEVKDLYIK